MHKLNCTCRRQTSCVSQSMKRSKKDRKAAMYHPHLQQTKTTKTMASRFRSLNGKSHRFLWIIATQICISLTIPMILHLKPTCWVIHNNRRFLTVVVHKIWWSDSLRRNPLRKNRCNNSNSSSNSSQLQATIHHLFLLLKSWKQVALSKRIESAMRSKTRRRFCKWSSEGVLI